MNGSFGSTAPKSKLHRGVRRWWRAWKWPWIVFVTIVSLVVLFFGGLFLANYGTLQRIYGEAMAGKTSIESAQSSVIDQNFAQATYDLQQAQENFLNLQKETDLLIGLRSLPVIGTQFYALDQLAIVGVELTKALETFTLLGEEIAGLLRTDGDVNLASLNPEQKRAVLERLTEAPPELESAKADIAKAAEALDNIPDSGLFEALTNAIKPLKEQLPGIQSMYDSSLPIIEVLPTIAGYPEEKTYLFLLQNNNELRPTGGFIGTYGVLKVKDGEIVHFETDNIYNLDEPAKEFHLPPPPGPFTQFIGSTQWFMRDSNWSPHFPESAKEAIAAYHREDGPEEYFDGVIAVTPTFIESLMELTGPIIVRDIEFRSDNLIDELQFQVGQAFRREGVSESERKEIIGELATQLMDRIYTLPKEQFPQIWEVFLRNVNQKHILVYLEDDNAQNLVDQQNWSGSVKNTEGDYLMVIDANLAALKTDEVMERDINYSVNMENGELIGRARITYKNTGSFTFFTTRYRSYTRIYLPEGSEIRSATGFMTGDLLQGGKAAEPEISQGLNKTVVSGFIAVEPATEGVIELEYKLPDSIAKQITQNGTYSLLTQKQSGTKGHGLHVEFDVGQPITWRSPFLDISHLDGDNKAIFQTDLLEDREFNIQL